MQPFPTPDTTASIDRLQLLRGGRGPRVLGVWAHPDDEAYLSIGLVRQVVRMGGSASVLTATRGEVGVPDDDPRTPAEVGALREAELRRAMALAGADLLDLLGHPDGGCADVDHERGVAEVLAAIEAVRPDLVVTFAPDGITGHPDHAAVQRWTTDAWRRAGRGVLVYATMTDEFLERNQALHERVGVFGDHVPIGVPTAEVDLAIALGEHDLDLKRQVLAAHASQTPGLAAAMGEATYRRWFDVEHFRRPTAAEVRTARPTTTSTETVRAA